MVLKLGVPIRNALGGLEQVVTRDGRTLRVEVTRRSLDLVLHDAAGREALRASIPYPRAGYGGHELVLSANESRVAMYLWSGQSEVGYEVFELGAALAHVACMPYRRGEGYGPAFSPDANTIVAAWATNTELYVDQEDEDEVELDDDARLVRPTVVDWAEIHLRPLPDGPIRTCVVRVRLHAGHPQQSDESFYPDNLALSDAEVAFDAPWARVRVPLPLPESIVVDGPAIA